MDELRTWSDLRREIGRRPKGTQGKLAVAIQMDPSQLSRNLKTEGGLTVAQARSAEEFLRSAEAAEAAHPGPRPQSGRDPRASKTRLPVYGYAAATDGDRFVLNEGQILEELELPMGISVGPGDYFIVRAAGSSMEPRIVAGEPQVVRWNYPPARDKGVVVEFNDGTAVIKNFKGWRDGRLWVEQFNPQKQIDYDSTKVKALHAVVLSF